MRLIVYIVIALMAYFLQGQVFPFLFTRGWIPNIFLTSVVIITIIHGRKNGIIAAIFAGLFHDIAIGNFLGIHFFPYIMVAILLTIPTYRIYQEQWYLSMAAVVIGTLIDAVVRMSMLYLAREDVTFTYFIMYGWPTLWINAMLAFVVHHFVWRMEAKDEYIW